MNLNNFHELPVTKIYHFQKAKMIDFFTSTKKDFLKFYSHEITDEEYEVTRQDVLRRFDYWNIDSIGEDVEVDGIMIGRIINTIMMINWLQERK